MLETLNNIDCNLFFIINSFHSDLLDTLMWYVSKTSTWLPLYLVLVALLFRFFGWKHALLMITVTVLAVGLSDYVASGIIKKTVCRLRPSHEPGIDGLVHVVNGYKGGLYGFVSSHAANTFTVAVMMSFFFRKRWLWVALISWCCLVSYSRVYLGVHYPGDIVGGMFVGAAVSFAVICVYNNVRRRLKYSR